MSATASSPDAWAASAARLARRARDRARAGALLSSAAVGIAGGAVLAVAARALLGADESLSRGLSVALASVGVAVGVVAAARVRTPSVSHAAWALDRLAAARDRGLTAALVPGAAGREACDDLGPAGPPRVRLRPPEGLVLFASAGLLAAIAWTWSDVLPAADSASSEEDEAAPRTSALAAAPQAQEREAEAMSLARRARSVAAAREALGLPSGASLDPERVAERLASKGALEAARRAAAAEGTALPGSDDPAALDALARVLAEDPSGRVESLRREALALRAAATPPRVPLDRRETVARYLALRASGREGGR